MPDPKEEQSHFSYWQEYLNKLKEKKTNKERYVVIQKLVGRAERRMKLIRKLKKLGAISQRINLLSKLRPIISLDAKNIRIQEETVEILRELNLNEIAKINKYINNKAQSAIVVIIGCKQRLRKLETAIKATKEKNNQISVIGVIANAKKADWKIDFDEKFGIIELPCRDTYEALPEKLVWLCLALKIVGCEHTLLKVDDDIKSINNKLLSRICVELDKEDYIAAGSPISINSPLEIDRGWHLGKCSDKVNQIPYEGLGPTMWMSGGAGYLIKAKGLEDIGAFGLHSWNFVKSQIYEDLTISWILESCENPIKWIDDWQNSGIKNERTDELSSGMVFQKKSEDRRNREK